MEKTSKILVTGASGLIGSALVRLLRLEGYENVLTPDSLEVDCRIPEDVDDYFLKYYPEYVFHLAAQVGGIHENDTKSADFIYDNTMMHSVIFNACRFSKVKKLLFPGSACAYPKQALQPIKEQDFLNGPPEQTNLAYAIAKQNGIVMAQSYAKQYGMRVALPMVTNTYGIGDRSSHVIPQLMQKFCSNEDVVLWGTGRPLREFIYADDVASAFLFLMENYDSQEIINVGTGREIPINALAAMIATICEYKGKASFDNTKPDGAMRKVLDSSRINAMGWAPKVSLEDGLRKVILQ